jgi:maleamate amidohydrolase
MTNLWDGLFGEDEMALREAGGYGEHIGVGSRPAVIVIDAIRSFTGYPGEDHMESVKTFRTSCGPYAWAAIPAIERLLAAGRERELPTFFTRAALLPAEYRRGKARKNRRLGKESPEVRAIGHEYPDEIAPLPGELIIEKHKPSVFFGTPLLNHLQVLEVNHVIVAGTTTSGCVRASVYDAFSYNFGVTVPQECVFDRFQTSHRVALHDMDSKYADVVPLDDVLRELEAVVPLPSTAAPAVAAAGIS